MVEAISEHESLARRIIDGGISAAAGWQEVVGLTEDRTGFAKRLPQACALYAFMCGDRVLYVGSTKDLRARVRSHDVYWDAIGASGTHFAYLGLGEIVREEMLRIEDELIRAWLPPLNRTARGPRKTWSDVTGKPKRERGRPLLDKDERRQMLSIRLAPGTWAALDLLVSSAGVGRTAVVERLILEEGKREERRKR